MQENIEKALTIALQALPKCIHTNEPEKYRVEMSADVTAHCRQFGLLTPTQYLVYVAYYPAPNMGRLAKLLPSVREADGTSLGFAPQMPDRQYVPVPRSEELRREFLAIQDPHHDLFQHDLRVPQISERSLIG